MSIRILAPIGCIAFLLACARDEGAVRSGETGAAPNLVSLTATEYAVQAPDTVPSGWTALRIVNRGREIHYGHMVRLDSGKTVHDLVTGYAEAIRASGPRPKWVARFGGPGGVAPGDSSSVTQFLEPGAYVWICPIEDEKGTPHFTRGEVEPFVVRDAGAPTGDRATAPTATAVIRLTDFSFDVDTALRAGKHTIRVENAGVEPHDLVLMKLAPGKSIEDLRRALNPERARRDAPAVAPEPFESLASIAGGIAVIAPKMQAFFDTTLSPGEYALACMTTAPDGRSHIEHGMLRPLTVR